MTTTRSRSADHAENSVSDVDGGPKRVRGQVDHRNTVSLVGELTEPVEPRQRADSGEVLTFRLGVRVAPSADGVEGLQAGGGRDAAAGGRRDVVDCVVAPPALRRRLESYLAGDVIEVEGALRHRFWNTGGRVQSRYEVDVVVLKRLARPRPARS